MNRFRSPTACALVVCSLVAAAPTHAAPSAQPSPAELKQARERFAEGRRLEDAGNFGEALVIFQSVARVKMTPQVRFHIALCWMKMGKPVEALTNFRQAMQEAGDSAPNVVAEAKVHIATLEKQVAVVIVDIPSDDQALSVTLDERAVSPSVPLDVEPGNHRVVLRKTGQTVDDRWMTLGAGEQVRVGLSPRANAPPQLTSSSTNSTTNVATNPPSSTATNPSTNVVKDSPTNSSTTAVNGRQIASYVAFGLAGASVLGLSVSAILRADRLTELETACPSFKGCERNVEPIVRDGKAFATGVNIFAVVAGAAAVTGVVLFAVSRGSTPRHGAKIVEVRVNPMVGFGGGFVTLQGRF